MGFLRTKIKNLKRRAAKVFTAAKSTVKTLRNSTSPTAKIIKSVAASTKAGQIYTAARSLRGTKAPTAREIISKPSNLKPGESIKMSPQEVRTLRKGLSSGEIPQVSYIDKSGKVKAVSQRITPKDREQAQIAILKHSDDSGSLRIIRDYDIQPIVIEQYIAEKPYLQDAIIDAQNYENPTFTESIFSNLGSSIGGGIKEATEPIKPLIYAGLVIAALLAFRK